MASIRHHEQWPLLLFLSVHTGSPAAHLHGESGGTGYSRSLHEGTYKSNSIGKQWAGLVLTRFLCVVLGTESQLRACQANTRPQSYIPNTEK